MRFALATLALVPAVVQGLTITSPNPTNYWVQNTSNIITWTESAGDPSQVSILVVNGNNLTLNGPFPIAEFVNVSDTSTTITNVTLRPGGSYAIEFVNSTNLTQVFATSQNFTVMPPGTAPANVSTTTSSLPSSTGSSSSSNPSSTAPTTSSAGPSTTGNAAPRSFAPTSLQAVYSVMALCGVSMVSALLL